MKKGTGDAVLIRLAEYEDLAALAGRIDALLRAGVARYVFDLDSVAVVNSTLLGVFVKTRNAVVEEGGDVLLARPSEFVAKILATTGLDQVFTIAADVHDAVDRIWPPTD